MLILREAGILHGRRLQYVCRRRAAQRPSPAAVSFVQGDLRLRASQAESTSGLSVDSRKSGLLRRPQFPRDFGIVDPLDVDGGLLPLQLLQSVGRDELHGTRAIGSHVSQERNRIPRRYAERLRVAVEGPFVVGEQPPKKCLHLPMIVLGRREWH